MNEEIEMPTFELAPTDALASIERAQIDVQISTAKRYPRQLSKVKQTMLGFATLDVETAEACFYTLPRGGKNIQGPSVRLAEIAVSCYGNLRAGSRILQTVTTGDCPHVVVQAVAHDLENNTAITIEKRRRITSKKDFKTGGRKPIDEDDINLAANAGSAIAFRDAVFKVVPMALIKPVYDAAKQVAIGNATTLADRRGKIFDRLAKMGAAKDRVLKFLGKSSIEDIGLDDIETLIGIGTGIKDGQFTIDEAFADSQAKETPEEIAKRFATTPKADAPSSEPAKRSKRETTPATATASASSGSAVVATQEPLPIQSNDPTGKVKELIEFMDGSAIAFSELASLYVVRDVMEWITSVPAARDLTQDQAERLLTYKGAILTALGKGGEK